VAKSGRRRRKNHARSLAAGGPSPGGPGDLAERKLQILDAATSLEDLAGLPGNRLESLKGDRKGQHSIRINNQWRVCCRWKDGDAFDVEIVDYH
jgi:proteic killer suppression protein